MLVWGLFWGAMVGLTSHGIDGLLGGAALGALAGHMLRRALRTEWEAWQREHRAALPPTADAPPQNHASAQPLPEPASTASVAVWPAEASSAPLSAAATAAIARTQAVAQAQAAAEVASVPVVDMASPQSVVESPRSATPTPRAAPEFNASSTRPVTKSVDMDAAFESVRGWLFGGNTIVRLGLVILFIGLVFLARYAAAAGLFPVELRLAAVGAVGVALLALGYAKRGIRRDYALSLQGGGVAVLYLTLFAAFRMGVLTNAYIALALMVLVCALSCALALLQNAKALALLAFAGGYATPVLLSTGSGNHVALFGYYTVLNLGLLWIAQRRAWRALHLLGFAATFGIASLWVARSYHSGLYASVQPFIIGFVLTYVAAAVFYARRSPTQLGHAVDSTLVFGTPLVGFGLQAALVQHFEYGSAFSALAFGVLYVGLARVLWSRGAGHRLLVECFLALGVGFATLAVPLALDARWTSGVWALEGLAAFWVGARQARWMPRAFGLLLQVLAVGVYLSQLDAPVAAWPLANPFFIGAVLVALPLMTTAWLARGGDLPHSGSRWAQAYAAVEAAVSVPAFIGGFVLWCLAWVVESHRLLPALSTDALPVPVFDSGTASLLALLAFGLSAGVALYAGQRTRWAVATWPARVVLPVMALVWLVHIANGHHWLDWPGTLLWPVMVALHLWLLHRMDHEATQGSTPPRWTAWLHAGTAWLAMALLGDALWLGIDRADLWRTAWASVVWLVSGTAVLMALTLWAGRPTGSQRRWPLAQHAQSYHWLGALPLALLVALGALTVALLSSGQTRPLPYIPLLNPTDVAIALALMALVWWRRSVLAVAPSLLPSWRPLAGPAWWPVWGALAFVAINTVWLRVAHHFFGVAWDATSLFNSFVVQTGYAILWTLVAFVLMLQAHRRALRPLWLAGAGLLGLVVLKLLLIDLSNAGGSERIIAFIAVGALMLAVGYFAPLPPRATTKEGT